MLSKDFYDFGSSDYATDLTYAFNSTVPLHRAINFWPARNSPIFKLLFDQLTPHST